MTISRRTNSHPNQSQATAIDLQKKPNLSSELRDADTVIYTPTPATRDSGGYQKGYLEPVENIIPQLADDTRFILVSSTRVYRGWPDQTITDRTQTMPADLQGELLCRMEERALSRSNSTVVRPSGIYGRSFAKWKNITAGKPLSNRIGNRIHATDLARFIAHLTTQSQIECSYLCSDELPASEAEIWHYLTGEIQAPEAESYGLRYQATRLRASGFKLCYPSYREGLASLKR